LLSKILPVFAGKQRPLKIVFLHEMDATSSTWTRAHAIGRRSLEANFPEQVTTSHIDYVLPGVDDEIRIEAAVRGGADVIFTTSAPMMPACLKVAARHPDVKFLNCSLNVPHPLVRTYYARMNEVKYLLGMLAGILTQGNEIGYLAHYPIYGTPAGINAFALGVKAVRPSAKVILRWTCVEAHQNSLDFADKENINIIYGRDQKDPTLGGDFMKAYNLYQRLADGSAQDLATPALHWDSIYKEIVRSILDGTWTNEAADTQRALNYWWGLQSGCVAIEYESILPTASHDLLSIMEAQLMQGNLQPFSGMLYAQGHTERKAADGIAFSPEELIHMDWLLENVEGSIPHTRDLISSAHRLVAFQGLPCAKD
ncbi:MAG: BMP family ABC transporter substrate-binding protein, partial [Faecalibacterium sp.]